MDFGRSRLGRGGSYGSNAFRRVRMATLNQRWLRGAVIEKIINNRALGRVDNGALASQQLIHLRGTDSREP